MAEQQVFTKMLTEIVLQEVQHDGAGVGVVASQVHLLVFLQSLHALRMHAWIISGYSGLLS